MHVHVAHSAHRSGMFCMEMTFPNQVPVERVAGVCHSSFESNSCIQVAEQPGGLYYPYPADSPQSGLEPRKETAEMD